MLILTPRPSSRRVNSALVNWAPWSLLNISGCPLARAQSSADKRKSICNVFDTSQLSTYRLYQSNDCHQIQKAMLESNVGVSRPGENEAAHRDLTIIGFDYARAFTIQFTLNQYKGASPAPRSLATL